jgi:hypothetical protein
MIINILAIQLPSAFELLPAFELPPALAGGILLLG